MTAARSKYELVEDIRRTVATRLREEAGADGTLSQRRAEQLIDQELDAYARGLGRAGASRSEMPTAEFEREVRQAVLDALFGLGRLQALLRDPTIENINVNGADIVWVKRVGSRKQRYEAAVADSDRDLIELIRHAATFLGPSERRFDPSSPQLDLRLEDGSRLSAVMEVSQRPVLSIRRHRLLDENEARLDTLVGYSALNPELATFLRHAVLARKNVVIGGGTNAGKTTLLRALANEIPPTERIITIEKSLELGIERYSSLHEDIVVLEAREPNVEGEGEISVSQLVQRSLRMDPDRVIVGEVLGDEVIDMLNAMSQGNDGSMCTIHADSSDGIFRRIWAYAIQSPVRLPVEATNLLIAGSIDLVVFIDQVRREDSLYRFVASVREIEGADGKEIHSREVFRSTETMPARPVPGCPPTFLSELMALGYEPPSEWPT